MDDEDEDSVKDKKRSKSLDHSQRKAAAAAGKAPPAASNNNYNNTNTTKKESKNVQGTSSHSEPSTKSFSRRFSHQQQAAKQQQQLKPMQNHSGDASSAGSGYESGPGGRDTRRSKRASSSFIKSCRLVSASSAENGRGAKQVSAKDKERRAAHCKSSGYESCSNGEREEAASASPDR